MQCLVAFQAYAQVPEQRPAAAAVPEQRLLDRTPFDLVVLKQAAGGQKLEVLPLNLPQRPLTAVPTAGALKVRLLERPTEEFEVSWSSVAQVLVFEQVLLQEAQRLTSVGDFDAAYDYYARLTAEYPKLVGLNDAVGDYLRRNALALYQAKQHDRALALLLTLHKRHPGYAGLAAAVETIAGEIIQRYLREGNYVAARGVLDLWQTQFTDVAAQPAADWQRRFEAAATRQVGEAARLVQERNYVAARKAVGKARAIWPSLQAATSVVAQIEREFPFVTVGVSETSPRKPMRRIDCWPAIRASRLTQRLLAEEVGFGSEGGEYTSPFGEWSLDESGLELGLKLNSNVGAESISADSIARFLLSLSAVSNPFFRADFAALLGGVAITPDGVQLHLNRVHVRPESLLQVPPAGAAEPFFVADYSPDQVLFAARESDRTGAEGMQAIVEQTLPDDEAAVTALIGGEIDVLDRVPPWQIDRLRANPEIRVESYRLPTVHVLIPNVSRPLLAKKEFRRALCFGIDRNWILQRVVLGGATQPGFEVVSGPFPAGASLSDPVRYGYNNRIEPRPFEPRLAAILATVAWAGVQNPAKKEKDEAPAEPPPIPELTLAHPKDPVARVACQSIQMQLTRVGIPLKLVEFTADDLLEGRVDYDLRYAELAVWEPLADARPLIGPGGIAGEIQSAYLNTALRQLDDATNWNDVRTRMAELHDIAHHELPVIPLWQTVNFFAYRTTMHGIGEKPVVLYQNIEHWSSHAGNNVARAGSRP